jgi:hypothetical protein
MNTLSVRLLTKANWTRLIPCSEPHSHRAQPPGLKSWPSCTRASFVLFRFNQRIGCVMNRMKEHRNRTLDVMFRLTRTIHCWVLYCHFSGSCQFHSLVVLIGAQIAPDPQPHDPDKLHTETALPWSPSLSRFAPGSDLPIHSPLNQKQTIPAVAERP